MALNGIPIDPDECIGDSLITINNSFVELDFRSLELSSAVGIVPDNSNLYSLLQSASGNIYSLIQTTTGNGVTQIVAGSNITISPVGGTGVVTISSSGGGGEISPYKVNYIGDGVTTDFVVTTTFSNAAAYRIDINGVLQEPTVGASVGDYDVLTPGVIRFTTPPPLNTKIVIVGASAWGGYSKTKHIGNGATQTFAVHGTYTNPATYRIDINGVTQEPALGVLVGDYNILTPGFITFTSPPPNNTKIVIIG
jgi:hypothetical protein